MKIISYLLTFYMLSLAFVPCGDGGGGLIEIIYHVSGISHEHNSADHDHSNTCDDDFCSPFCICSCCSSALDTPTELTVFTSYSFVPIYEPIPEIIDQLFLSNYHPSIWQPPRQA